MINLNIKLGRWQLILLFVALGAALLLFLLSGSKTKNGLEAVQGAYKDLTRYYRRKQQHYMDLRKSNPANRKKYDEKIKKLDRKIGNNKVEIENLSNQALADELSKI